VPSGFRAFRRNSRELFAGDRAAAKKLRELRSTQASRALA
jgi:hypothetical protein